MRDVKITDIFPEADDRYEQEGESSAAVPGVFVLAATVLSLVLSVDLIVL